MFWPSPALHAARAAAPPWGNDARRATLLVSGRAGPRPPLRPRRAHPGTRRMRGGRGGRALRVLCVRAAHGAHGPDGAAAVLRLASRDRPRHGAQRRGGSGRRRDALHLHPRAVVRGRAAARRAADAARPDGRDADHRRRLVPPELHGRPRPRPVRDGGPGRRPAGQSAASTLSAPDAPAPQRASGQRDGHRRAARPGRALARPASRRVGRDARAGGDPDSRTRVRAGSPARTAD
jgi:hypothetical protein